MRTRPLRYASYRPALLSGARRSWSPLSLGSSLAAWYRADAGCFTDAACLFASASSQYLSRTSEAALQAGDIDFSVVFWVKVPAADAIYYDFVGKGRGNSAGGEWGLFKEVGTGQVWFGARNAADSASTQALTDDALGDDLWTMVEFFHDSGNDMLGVRINNGAAKTVSHTGGVFAGSNALRIGFDTIAALSGSIARVGFWKRLLTAGDRTSLLNAGAGKFYADLTTAEKVLLVEYWNLCESSSTRVGSHAGLNLTPTNGPTVAAGPGEGAAVNKSPRKRIADQSGNARHRTQATIGAQSLYLAAIQNGRAVGRYDGVDDIDVTGAIASFVTQPFTVIGALKTGNTNGTLQWDGLVGGAARCSLSHGAVAMLGGQEISAGIGIAALHTAGDYHVYEATFDGASSSLVVDGATLISGDAGTRVLGAFAVGGNVDGGQNSAMDECETLIIVGATAAQKASARAYLRQMWNTP